MKFLTLLAFLSLSLTSWADNPTSKATTAYPLTTCVVSGDKLAGMGGPVIINYHGTEVRFCCHDCVESFNVNPDKYLAKLKAAAAEQAFQKK